MMAEELSVAASVAGANSAAGSVVGSATGSATGSAVGAEVTAEPSVVAPMAVTEFPWLQGLWKHTAGGLEGLHHGLLVTGVAGVAKREFAVELSRLLLCGSPKVEGEMCRACGACQNCVLFAGGTHPDFHVLCTELEACDGRIELLSAYSNRYQDMAAREKRAKPSRVIPVDHIRVLIERFYAHSHIAARRVALLVPAERMNVNASNALLKLLEEPPANSIFILVSALPATLPATIRSRCVQIGVPLPERQQAEAWLTQRMAAEQAGQALALAGGAPLQALRLFEKEMLALQDDFLKGVAELRGGQVGAVELAGRFKQYEFLQWLDWLHRFCCDLGKWVCGAGVPRWSEQGARFGLEQNWVAGISRDKVFSLYDEIGRYRKIAQEQLNEVLAMEELLLALQGVVRVRG